MTPAGFVTFLGCIPFSKKEPAAGTQAILKEIIRGTTMILRLSIALLACVFITGCGKKIVTTWVDGKKHGFEETFNSDGELILRECFQAGVKVEPSICNEDPSR